MASEPEPVAWPATMASVPHHGRTRVVGYVISPEDPAWGKYGVTESIDWLNRNLQAALLAAEQRGMDAERALLDWMAKDICLELSWGQLDPQDEGGECGWMVHRRWGNINDTEWHLIGTGDTPAEAIAAAIRKGDANV